MNRKQRREARREKMHARDNVTSRGETLDSARDVTAYGRLGLGLRYGVSGYGTGQGPYSVDMGNLGHLSIAQPTQNFIPFTQTKAYDMSKDTSKRTNFARANIPYGTRVKSLTEKGMEEEAGKLRSHYDAGVIALMDHANRMDKIDFSGRRFSTFNVWRPLKGVQEESDYQAAPIKRGGYDALTHEALVALVGKLLEKQMISSCSIKALKDKCEEFGKSIEELKEAIDYMPGGICYEMAKVDFEERLSEMEQEKEGEDIKVD